MDKIVDDLLIKDLISKFPNYCLSLIRSLNVVQMHTNRDHHSFLTQGDTA